MKVNQKVRTKRKNRFGTITEILKKDGFLNNVIVLLDSGVEMLYYESEREVIDV
jgi:hypothetical protein